MLLLASCQQHQRGSSFDLPQHDDHAVATEARVAPLIERTQRGSNGPGECTVRFLGEKDDAVWVWATCRWLPSSAIGGPFLVQGDKVTGTKDGSDYDDSVRQLFPYDLAEAILFDADRLQPEVGPIG